MFKVCSDMEINTAECDCRHEQREYEFSQIEKKDICTFLECGCEKDQTTNIIEV